MNLYWYGQNSIGVDSGGHSLVVDPLDLEKELKSAKAAEVVLLSRPQKTKIPVKANSFVINNPGEYDIKGFFVLGFGDFAENIAYIIEAEGVKICYLTGLNKELSDVQLEALSEVDILAIDVGETSETNEVAAKIVNQVEPRMVVPIGYNAAGKPTTFLKEMGASEAETQNKLNIKKKDLPQEETKILLLNVTK
ncbi:MAG: MBL fold metallo-hydrolase [Candidatus Sungbacteria bacterium]|uniref:MBL fold metallo-hydrolase n=3 Tax=Candidatus Sungiibacteriota bacterium TaxID=2750080 RepID=A0A932DSD4_9BACT|nr:MBL fold metallo-hydrolase [Candidatus Sungbacteria bacterium]